MRTDHPFRVQRSFSRVFASVLAVLFLVAFAAPALSEPAESGVDLTRLLERIEQEVSARPKLAEQPEVAQRLLRDVQFLRHQARETLTPELDRRFDALEVRIRTGRSILPPAPVGDKDLDKAGTVTGKVTRADSGVPFANVYVDLWHSDGYQVYSDYTDSQGNFSFEFVEPGQYYASTYSYDGYIDELYNNVPCPGGIYYGCDLSDGTPIHVADQGLSNINFALDLGGSVSGTVASTSGVPLYSVLLRIWNFAGEPVASGYTNGLGHFRALGLPTGSYFVSTQNFDVYRDELYDDLACPGSCDPTAGDAVAVVLGAETTGIDFVLDELGRISGSVIDGLTGEPIPNVSVYARNTQGSRYGYTDHLGTYEIGGLSPGTYLVYTSNFWGFDDELFDDVPCPFGNCDPEAGSPVAVAVNQTTSGIDFVLEGGCLPSDFAMCLTDDRFRVEATWTDFGGNSGAGHAVELTDDSGYFWFFGDDNIELVVKVLNACTLPGAHNFWVFAGGLTNVDVTLKITDTQTGQVKTYRNSLGTPFQPIQDTAAFYTCP